MFFYGRPLFFSKSVFHILWENLENRQQLESESLVLWLLLQNLIGLDTSGLLHGATVDPTGRNIPRKNAGFCDGKGQMMDDQWIYPLVMSTACY